MLKRYLQRQLCRIIDNTPTITKHQIIPITLYAVVVTIFASGVASGGIKLQVPLVLITLLLAVGPWLLEKGCQKIALHLAGRLAVSIKTNKQRWLSLTRRASSEVELSEWVREQYPQFASSMVIRELARIASVRPKDS